MSDVMMKNSVETGLEIAVVGMAARFPGAKNIHEFWANLQDGVETISFFSNEELGENGLSPSLMDNPDYIKAKGMLEDIENFDAFFFEYTPVEARIMDPQARVFHECCWEALEHAGYDPGMYDGKIGVYGGASDNFYWQALVTLSGTLNLLDPFSAFQMINKDYLTMRVSFKFNLRGPSLAVQTTCSTSLVAIHLACQGILSGGCSMALAGGVTVTVPSKGGHMYREGMVLSPDGHCRAFDAQANGFANGDGVGVVVLKLLEDAVADGDFIHAVIKGSAINNDGDQKSAFTAPSIKGQIGVIKTALSIAEVEPESISYIEAHGTGTPLGDPIEVEALKRAFNANKKGYCKIGSVKTNIGHLDTAAGVAGFIKTVLALKHRQIPPSLHYKTTNPKIDFANSPFSVNSELIPWENGKYPLRAGVSSFGIGGTNAHIILEEAPPLESFPGGRQWKILTFSAKTPTALDRVTGNFLEYLKKNANASLADEAFTLQVGRKDFRHRRMVVCANVDEAVAALADFSNLPQYSIEGDKTRMIFMFAGLGAQYVNMGLELYREEPYFREEMDRCFDILNPLLGYNIKEILYSSSVTSVSSVAKKTPAENPGELHRIEIAQLVVFIFEYALARLLMQWGIKPYAMIGYSFGEYTAACLSGVFSLEDVLKIIVTRGQLLSGVPGGAMLSVPLSRQELDPLLDSDLAVAIDNGSACIVAGSKPAVASFEIKMKKRRLMCMPVPHSMAMHSHMMAPILTKFEKALQNIRLNPPQVPYISNLTGKWIDAEEVVTPQYWSKHLRETVRFYEGLMELVKKPNSIFIEIGPGRDLSTLVGRFIDKKAGQRVLNLTRPPQKEFSDLYYLLNKMGYLWLYGGSINWPAFYPAEKRRRMPLPTYPFERQRYWIDTNLSRLIKNLAVDRAVLPENENIPAKDGAAVSKSAPAVVETNLTPLQRSELSTPYTPPSNGLEKIMKEIWERFFGTGPIGVEDDFFELGGDSLKAMNVSGLIHKELNVEIPVPEFFSRQTIKGLAEYIKGNTETKAESSIGFAEEREYYPVSSAQRRLYVLQQMAEGNTSYNEPSTVVLEGHLEKEKLENAFRQLIKRHESLRTSFEIFGGEPVQKIHNHQDVKFAIDYIDADQVIDQWGKKDQSRDAVIEKIVNRFIRSFDLGQAPLLRVGLINLEQDQVILMVDMHHIITDGTSRSILVGDFITLYKGEILPPLPVQYKDFSQWQNHLLESGKIKKQEDYWLKEFESGIPEIDLPSDYPRPAFLSFEGNRITESIGHPETAALKKIASTRDATLYMVLLAIFNIFLSKLTGQEDIVCGSLIAGRRRAELQRLIGMFVNTLALRDYPTPGKTFEEFLKEIKVKTLNAYQNQDYQFENLVDKVVKNRDTSRNPLFDVIFVLQNMEGAEGGIAGLKVKPYGYKNMTSKFDLKLETLEDDEKLFLNFEYRTTLFKDQTITRYICCFKKVLTRILENPGIKISDIEIISGAEKQQLLYEFNDTTAAYPVDKTLYQLFAQQVERSPDHTALIGQIANSKSQILGENVSITYRELNEKSNQLAYLLKEKGAGPDTIVGIMMNRSLEAVIGILGILGAGAAYLPIDPEYPEERINFMLTDSNARILLTSQEISVLSSPEAFMSLAPVTSLAYIIYTSGSTGKPKGVMVEQRNIVNYISWAIKNYVQGEAVNFPLFTSLSFDLTITSIFTPLLSGNTILVYEGDSKEPLVEKVIADNRVGVVKLTPSHLKLIAECGSEILQSRVKRFILGGEALETQLTGKIVEKFNNDIVIYNEYGPTETAVGCMIYQFSPGIDTRQSVPIGIPAGNVQIYVLDKNKLALPPGVPGEMYISGHGVARGYLNRPGLTAERFVDNPFLPGKRMYKTGDLARFIPGGNIEFLGRIDHQVKIRGFRIELEEIQDKLMGYRKNKPIANFDRVDNEVELKNRHLCQRCLLPGNYPGIHLDDEGVCNICREFERYKDEVENYFKTGEDFKQLMAGIQQSKQGEYDCLLLFSGGKDSTYVLYQLIDMGLKVLTFTFDNGYISEAAFNNIKRTTSALNVENIVCRAGNMNKVFVESLNAHHDVCHGCWNALNTYGIKVAHEHGINLVISGLSRGQIFEMRLEGLFQQGIFREEEVEEHLLLFRKSFHSKNNKFTRLLDVDLPEEVVDNIYFVDFFRYFAAPVAEIRQYLKEKGWIQPEDTGFCSSNCLINDVGIYVHFEKEGYHFYAPQLSWDCRLGCIPREQGLKEVTFAGDGKHQLTNSILEEIGYYNPPIKNAVVIDREGDNGDKKLTAYIVSPEQLVVPELRDYLARQVPDYMIPAEFVQLDSIPLTPNGKVDRNALQTLGKKMELGVEYIAPGSYKEITVANIWKEILRLENVGIHDNFFDLGGSSVDIIRVNSRLREAFEEDIPIVAMYQYTTVAALSRYLDKGENEEIPRKDRSDIMERGREDRAKRREKRQRRRK